MKKRDEKGWGGVMMIRVGEENRKETRWNRNSELDVCAYHLIYLEIQLKMNLNAQNVYFMNIDLM